MKILDALSPDTLADYCAYKITSAQAAATIGVHPVSLRRAIKRDPRPPTVSQSKAKLFAARRVFRASIAHLPAKEIMALANCSLSTASRIRQEYRTPKNA